MRFARPTIHHNRCALRRPRFLQKRGNELQQMIHLLELAPRILIHPPIWREDVQSFEQFQALAFAQAELRISINRY
jgi:hypothetical protein